MFEMLETFRYVFVVISTMFGLNHILQVFFILQALPSVSQLLSQLFQSHKSCKHGTIQVHVLTILLVNGKWTCTFTALFYSLGPLEVLTHSHTNDTLGVQCLALQTEYLYLNGIK